MSRKHRIAVIPGDGIGKETTPEGLRVLDAAARRFGFELEHFVESVRAKRRPKAESPKQR